MGKDEDLCQKDINTLEEFRTEAAGAITWSEKWDKDLDDSDNPFFRRFRQYVLRELMDGP